MVLKNWEKICKDWFLIPVETAKSFVIYLQLVSGPQSRYLKKRWKVLECNLLHRYWHSFCIALFPQGQKAVDKNLVIFSKTVYCILSEYTVNKFRWNSVAGTRVAPLRETRELCYPDEPNFVFTKVFLLVISVVYDLKKHL